MLLNTWLTAAKRHLFNSPAGMRSSTRRSGFTRCRPTESEVLENRALLTALVINNSNVDSFVDANGHISITNATLGTNDSLVIESINLASNTDAISINLSNIALERLAIETVNVTAFSGTAIDINLTNVTGNRTIALEDVSIIGSGSGIDIALDNTDSYGLTVEDSVSPTVHVSATNGSVIGHGIITENEIVAPADLEGVVLTVSGNSQADDFKIINNRQIQALNKDAVQVNISDSPTDGLTIANNVIGNEPGADVLFRSSGDTFVQPFELRNNGIDGEQLQQFVLDLRPLGLVFDISLDGKPFTVAAGSDVTQAETNPVLSSNNQVLTVDVTGFTPGETLLFVIDVDRAPPVPGDPPISTPIFGNDLIGAAVQFSFDAGNTGTVPKQVAGVMVGDANVFNASVFARGAGAAANVHGVNLNLTNSPLTNTEIFNNTITGVAGHGILFNAAAQSDVTGLITDNVITSGGQDGIHFDLSDSNFEGAINDNTIGGNSGNGIIFQPVVSRSGIVEEAFDGNPVVITSTNHQLQTGDVIVIQGMTNSNPSINHPGNGIHTITRLSNNTFSLNGVSGLTAGVNYNAGGAWYVPDFQGGVIAGVPQGPAQGLVTINLKATEPEGRITAIENPVGGGDVQLTSIGHGLSSGDRVRITGATGTLIDGDFKITKIDADTFSLDGANAVGTYDVSEGLAVWTTNIITGATNPLTGEIVVTSLAHGLSSGDEVRIARVDGNAAANGTFRVTRLSADTFSLQGSTGSGIYTPGTGYWTALSEATFTGDKMLHQMSGNSISGNGKAGVYVNLNTGTTFRGDILSNTIVTNAAKGIHIESHSYGVGETLPLDPANPLAIPGRQDISFNVNIGSDVVNTSPVTGIPLDGNLIDLNGEAGIAIEVLDLATGSFEILGNRITRSIDDGDSQTGWAGDGIYVTLESDRFAVDSNSLLVESLIENNTIGVDNLGNDGNGLSFNLTQRTKIQDLEVVKNFFVNNALDGFHFVRTENGSLNAVVFEDNEATNNGSDGFDLYAENSVDDRLDFKIRRNDINNNAEYGVRIDVQAAARIEVTFDTNDVIGNGHTSNGTGFHPNDAAANFTGHEDGPNFAGNAGAAGGVGIFGFEEVEIVFNAVASRISNNIGDGFSVDAFDERDTLRLDASFTDVEFVQNSLTGLRSHGAAFASIEVTSSLFNGNHEDGLRIVSINDKDSFFETRVGGSDIDLMAIGNQFVGNWHNGAILGQGVSAVFGTGTTTSEFANIFDGNGFTDPAVTGVAQINTGGDGLKITQNVGTYLHNLGRRRTIEADANFFRNNGGDGIDVGHDVFLEGGNVEHGYEVASDVDISINNAIISGNQGDGIEYLTDSILRIPSIQGGGQFISNPTDISSLHVSNSRIESNDGRGIDILNRVSEDSRVTLTNNEILTNTLSGVYVMNTMSHFQTQFGPNDNLFASITESGLRTPNIELRVQENNILDNGNQNSTSTVTIPDSDDANDSTGNRNADWTHNYRQVTGTLGGLVIRVGTADSIGTLNIAVPELELGESGIDAEVWKNTFNGNFGASVFLDSFVSVIPVQTQGWFDDDSTSNHPPRPTWRQGYRDPLSRLDMVFRENTGNSLDVTNGFAFVDNDEDYFKSRHPNGTSSPPNDHAHGAPTLTPGGFFTNTTRARNATRTLGFFDTVGGVPSIAYEGTGFDFSFEGHGTPTWRVESDYDFNNFNQTSTVQGFSTFENTVDLLNTTAGGNGGVDQRYSFQWDTGRNTSTFTGLTPYSLVRGDVFNVGVGENPIQADGLEENDSFLGATDLGVVQGAGFSVNALTASSLQPGILNIERKGDRDYYKFTTSQSFTPSAPQLLNINLGVLDLTGDSLQFMIYEVVPQSDTEEVPLVALNGIPQYTSVAPGGNSFIQVAAKQGTTYIIEVLSTEDSNLTGSTGVTVGGKPFVYGTTRSYTLSIDAPPGTTPVLAGSMVSAPPILVSTTSPGTTAAVSIADQNPFVESITDVVPSTISTSLNTLTVTFSEDVTRVDRTDFKLTRNGTALDLSGIIISPIDFQTFEITNLARLTGEAGNYQFSVNFATADIVDADLNLLQAGSNDVVSWTVNNTVTSTLDAVDNLPGDMLAEDAFGNRTLRSAINEANANFGPDVIQLQAGIYTLAIEGRFEDAGFTGDLDILESVTIRGTGATALDTVIDASLLDRVFHVYPGVQLTLENLTIRGGEAFDGAGILVEGTSTVSGATASTVGSVHLNKVNVINNEAYNQGGGIYNLGNVVSNRSSISMNTAGSRGGGVFNHGSVSLVNSTVSTNAAVSRGGGIYNELLSTAINTTISPAQGAGSVYALNSTIAFNTAMAEGGGLIGETSGSFRIGNTIIDRNSAPTSPDLGRGITSLGYNFIGNLVVAPSAAFLLPTDVAADHTAGVTEAGLNPLSIGANGTWAHTLTAGGFAVDAGSTALYAAQQGITANDVLTVTDQIGSPRLVEGDSDGVFRIDLGATEFFVSQPVAIIQATPNPAGVNEFISFDGSSSTHTLEPGTGRIVSYEWDFNYDGTTFDVEQTGITTTHSYPTLGSRTVGLRVTDDTGATDIQTIVVSVNVPSPPTIIAPFSGGTSDLTPTIKWVAGTGTFSLEVKNAAGDVVVSASGLTTTSYTPTTNLAPGIYTVTVTASNASGSATSDVYQFEVIRIALTDPLNFDVEFDTTPEFTFTAIPDANRYEIWVSQLDPVDRRKSLGVVINDANIDAGQALIPGTGLADYEPSTRLGLGYYRVWVRAFDVSGNAGDWSVGNQFTVEKPSITGPAFGTRVTIDSTPTITWTSVGAPTYELWLSQVSGSDVNGVPLTSTRLVSHVFVNDTEYTLPTTIGNGLFRVWVRAVDSDGEAGLWSKAYDFTKDLSVGPVLISPIQGATTTDRTPVFNWNAFEGADHYEIWVNNSTLQIARTIYNDNVPHVAGASSVYFTDTAKVLKNATYRWWVRAFNEDGQAGAWSNSETFFVPSPALTAPVGTVSDTNLPVFTWTGVPEYVRYELWVNNLTTGTSKVVYEPNLTGLTYTPDLPLQNGNFRAWIRAFDSVGNASQWSNPINFAVDALIGNAPTAINTLAGFDNSPTFIWSPVASATSYEIIVKNLLVTGQPVVLNEVATGTLDPTTGDLFYSTTTNLSSGSFRWWIRGLNADNTPGPWSQPLDFVVVSNGMGADSAGGELETVVTSLQPDAAWSDDLYSITVHPAAVVAAMKTVEEVKVDDLASEQSFAANDVDSIMEELATADWWTAEDNASVVESAVEFVAGKPSTVKTPEVTNGDRESSEQTRSAAVIGLALATLTGGRGAVRRREEE